MSVDWLVRVSFNNGRHWTPVTRWRVEAGQPHVATARGVELARAQLRKGTRVLAVQATAIRLAPIPGDARESLKPDLVADVEANLPDTPATVAAKAQQARAVGDAFRGATGAPDLVDVCASILLAPYAGRQD